MFLGEAQRGHGVRFDFRFRWNEHAAFGGRDFLPDERLPGREVHFPAQFGRDGDLTALSDRRFHMIPLSCATESGNFISNDKAIRVIGYASLKMPRYHSSLSLPCPAVSKYANSLIG